jgi:SH3-like domain-containing protein
MSEPCIIKPYPGPAENPRIKKLPGGAMRKLSLVFLTAMFTLFTAHHSQALCVKAEKANLRTGPGTGYDVVWEVYRFMPLVKVGVSVSGKWYAVKDVDGDVTWISANLVTAGYHCAVVRSETVNVRTGPGTRYPKSPVSPAKQYYSFKVEKRKGNWIKVKDEWGGRGWIRRDFLFVR